jgi:hypothetical protein
MIQLTGFTTTSQNFYINLYDKMVDDGGDELTISPLVSITSQETSTTKNFIPSADYTDKLRCVKMTVDIVVEGSEDLDGGKVYLGNRSYPYGLYDVTIYQNSVSAPTNLNPSAGTIKATLWKGLLNLNEKAGNEAVTYTTYNDTQKQNVYITNTTI